MYRRCDLCNTKHALKYYYNNKDKVLEKRKNYYKRHKDYYSEYKKKRKNKNTVLKDQFKHLTETIKTTVSVS